MVNAQHNSNSWEVHIGFMDSKGKENACKKTFVSQNIYYWIEAKKRREKNPNRVGILFA